MLLESRLGLSPWDVLNQGIAKHTPLDFGIANTVAALVVLVVAWRLGATIGPGTVANAVLIGIFVDAAHACHAFAGVEDAGAARAGARARRRHPRDRWRVGPLHRGALGAGPRDSLMLVLVRTGRAAGPGSCGRCSSPA